MQNDGLNEKDLTPTIIYKAEHINKNKVIGAIVVLILLIVVLFLFKKPSVTLIGDRVENGECLAYIHANNSEILDSQIDAIKSAYKIVSDVVNSEKVVDEII